MLVQVRVGFAYPAFFSPFAKLFQIQFGLLGDAVLAALLYLLPHSRLPWMAIAGLRRNRRSSKLASMHH